MFHVYHLEKIEKFLQVEERYNLVYIWNTGDISKSINKKTFKDPLMRMEYNPCLINSKV